VRGGTRSRLRQPEVANGGGAADAGAGEGVLEKTRTAYPYLHAVRVVRRKLPQFAAIPPSVEKTIP